MPDTTRSAVPVFERVKVWVTGEEMAMLPKSKGEAGATDILGTLHTPLLQALYMYEISVADRARL